jgi:3-hydroxy-9,10-secoandrosta-1,3,5(10)-triene-9,17-dione monooxygenase reductase component
VISDEIREFRSALGQFATGVTIVTTRGASGEDVGVTANSFNSVSLEPPLVLWSVANSAGCHGHFCACEAFAVHVLSSRQRSLSQTFSRRCDDRFAGLEVQRNAAGVPIITGCAAVFECNIHERHEGGDHTIIVGHVTRFEQTGLRPLVFHNGHYAHIQAYPDSRTTKP